MWTTLRRDRGQRVPSLSLDPSLLRGDEGAGDEEDLHYLSPANRPVPFLDERSSLVSFFPLGAALAPTLEADGKAPPYCLQAAADFLTIAFYLSASISAKGWQQMLEKKADRPDPSTSFAQKVWSKLIGGSSLARR